MDENKPKWTEVDQNRKKWIEWKVDIYNFEYFYIYQIKNKKIKKLCHPLSFIWVQHNIKDPKLAFNFILIFDAISAQLHPHGVEQELST